MARKTVSPHPWRIDAMQRGRYGKRENVLPVQGGRLLRRPQHSLTFSNHTGKWGIGNGAYWARIMRYDDE